MLWSGEVGVSVASASKKLSTRGRFPSDAAIQTLDVIVVEM